MFVDKQSGIEREALRTYVLQKLQTMQSQFSQLLTEPSHYQFWDNLHNTIGLNKNKKEQEALFEVETQLKQLPDYITKWVDISVESAQRFDFFVATKAEEIRSGDKDHDYFWALQIRHDQMVALVNVLDKLLECIAEWVTQAPSTVVEDPIFLGLTEYGVEDQIYLEAENIHKKREKHLI